MKLFRNRLPFSLRRRVLQRDSKRHARLVSARDALAILDALAQFFIDASAVDSKHAGSALGAMIVLNEH